jgi:uncharacterized protein YndB with AHSA1/START domain
MAIYILVALVGSLIAAFGVLGVLGSLLPQTHTAKVVVEVGKPRDEVWRMIDEVEKFPAWMPDITKVEVLEAGGDAGGRKFRQTMGRNSMVMEETVKDRPSRVLRTILDDKGPFSGSWDHVLEEAGPGRTRVTVIETGTIKSAIPRAIMKYLIGEDYFLKKFGKAMERAGA